MMKILFVITGLGVGGAERQLVDVARSLAARGNQVVIAYMTGEQLIGQSETSVQFVSLGADRSPLSIIRVLYKLRCLVLELKPNVVHSHMFHANLIARLLRLSVRIPKLVCTAHSNNEGGAVRMLAYRLTRSLDDVFTNVSVEAVREYEAKGASLPGKMLAVLNGIDADLFKPSMTIREHLRNEYQISDCQVVMAVGRLVGAKDYPSLILAFSKLVETNPLARLWILGDGPLRCQLENECERLSLNGKVRFFGIRNDVENLLNAADLFVLSSRWEGFGLVVAEAMANEKVVVATDCGGVAEVVGDCGYLVPPEDPDSLYLAMRKALALTVDQQKALGVSARARVVENFSLERVADKWMDIYNVH